jgi:hypothetical protein
LAAVTIVTLLRSSFELVMPVMLAFAYTAQTSAFTLLAQFHLNFS